VRCRSPAAWSKKPGQNRPCPRRTRHGHGNGEQASACCFPFLVAGRLALPGSRRPRPGSRPGSGCSTTTATPTPMAAPSASPRGPAGPEQASWPGVARLSQARTGCSVVAFARKGQAQGRARFGALGGSEALPPREDGRQPRSGGDFPYHHLLLRCEQHRSQRVINGHGPGVPRPGRDHRASAQEGQEGLGERLSSPANRDSPHLLRTMRADGSFLCRGCQGRGSGACGCAGTPT
jgi:hypothetical protein